MGALERRGKITDPRALPELRREVKPQPDADVQKPEKPVFPRSHLVPERPQPQAPQPVRPQEAPQQQPVDVYGYLSKLVERGKLTPEQGMQIMGKTEQERQQIVLQYQVQEKQEEAALRKLGIYDQAKRLAEIQREIPDTLVKIEGGYKTSQELRNKEDLSPTNLGQRILDLRYLPLSRFGFGPHWADIVVVDNPDGTQTKYVDRAPQWFHKRGYVEMESGVYKETYGKKKKFRRRELLGRERVGEAISVGGWDPNAPESQREFSIITTKFRDLQKEAMGLEREMNRKQKDYYYSQFNLGDRKYEPTKKELKVRKNLEDAVNRMLWSVKDTPEERRAFYAKNVVSSSMYYGLFQVALPYAAQEGLVAQLGLGVGAGIMSQLLLFKPKDIVQYGMKHPVQTGVSLASVGLLFVNPVWGIGLGLSIQALMPLIPEARKKLMELQAAKEFKNAHPELKNKKERKAAFKKEYPFMQQQKAIETFVGEHKDWFEELKRLNPEVPEQTIKELMQAMAGDYMQEIQELQMLQGELVTKNSNFAIMPRLVGAPFAIAGGIILTGLGVPAIVGQLVSSMVVASATTGVQMELIKRSMTGTKNDVAERFPELLPENRRNGNNGQVKTV